jgi:hypothetical protein
LSLCQCTSTPVINRPPCTWKLWGVNGSLERAQDRSTLSCSGPDAADCIGMTKADFSNLLSCGAQ